MPIYDYNNIRIDIRPDVASVSQYSAGGHLAYYVTTSSETVTIQNLSFIMPIRSNSVQFCRLEIYNKSNAQKIFTSPQINLTSNYEWLNVNVNVDLNPSTTYSFVLVNLDPSKGFTAMQVTNTAIENMAGVRITGFSSNRTSISDIVSTTSMDNFNSYEFPMRFTFSSTRHVGSFVTASNNVIVPLPDTADTLYPYSTSMFTSNTYCAVADNEGFIYQNVNGEIRKYSTGEKGSNYPYLVTSVTDNRVSDCRSGTFDAFRNEIIFKQNYNNNNPPVVFNKSLAVIGTLTFPSNITLHAISADLNTRDRYYGLSNYSGTVSLYQFKRTGFDLVLEKTTSFSLSYSGMYGFQVIGNILYGGAYSTGFQVYELLPSSVSYLSYISRSTMGISIMTSGDGMVFYTGSHDVITKMRSSRNIIQNIDYTVIPVLNVLFSLNDYTTKQTIDHVREKVNEFRQKNNVPSKQWEEPIIVQNVTPIKASHWNEIFGAVKDVFDVKKVNIPVNTRLHFIEPIMANSSEHLVVNLKIKILAIQNSITS